ncbi:polyhydroxyalkanoate synthesis regulator DNA-binding domain-containing protein [Legionella impletisoli]|uniref:Polyhydroxyalkanoate synthesis repressor PhaR n=1 Tax=Legionella impletisoli TaxID=343510 RepID=A0A917JVW4_9GAMM|nr:polyhydroxyalkanoate synthesis regulator DNA-binding domain-containing protein [Legionella impletisoli]GGI88772.1 polyhydroxyalkanoate synthesis repressor PhaR [Legionella impletisoli]
MTRLIKKYKNRRLYDTEKSQYITIEDLQRYVVEGLDFKVIDSASEKDITNATLLQILVETETGTTQFLSSDILRQLILLAHHPMNESLKMMLQEMMQFMHAQVESNPYFSQYQKASETYQKQMQQFFSQWQDMFKK